jgi:hypothetical protein
MEKEEMMRRSEGEWNGTGKEVVVDVDEEGRVNGRRGR